MAENWYKALSDEMANGVSATDAVGGVLGGPAGMAKSDMSTTVRVIGEENAGSWSFGREEIEVVIAAWKALAEELEEDRDHFVSIQQRRSDSLGGPSLHGIHQRLARGDVIDRRVQQFSA